MNKKYTKIVATISDKRCEVEFIKQLFDVGMNVARLNTAHISTESALTMINNVRAVSDSIAILVDTKGPEIRTRNIDEPINVKLGDIIKVKGGDGQSNQEIIYVSYEHIQRDVPVGNLILIDDGDLALEVIEQTPEYLVCRVGNSGQIKNKKSVNTPGVSVDLPSISEKDVQFIEFAAKNDVDFIAHSFVRNKKDVLAVQEILDRYNSRIKIIAKIENLDGVNNIDEILEHAYGIMVARGDLGIEISAEKIPAIQRRLIRKAVQQKRPVIIATQMLHSMIDNPRPTRAEVSDVATAIYDRTDAIMLSGETAYGNYPVESVKVMSKIALEVEASKDKRNDLPVPRLDNETSAFLAEAAVLASKELKVKAIVTDTLTGKIARYIAAFRGAIPVYAKCHNGRVKRELALSYGVFPSEIQSKKNKHKLIETSLLDLVERDLITDKDTVVYVGGNFGVGGGTSFIEIASVEQMTYAKMKS
ncbi:pyruvate kinase [Aquipluma nitroreducens]|uniref:Pyruvate kinase n=1 Tax=Aquipluma nitroreducens TaxID=2010828 RepID=A0A5K7SH41_9BACT|nr:pyruvate kinase [Aquipluma nitroreducens]BBE20826.1 pyruvate kinase [Aquipluma nitroreducens]